MAITPDEILDVLSDLTSSKRPDVFSLTPLRANSFLTRRDTGIPALAFQLDAAGISDRHYQLHGLTIQVHVEATFWLDRKVIKGPMAVIECADRAKQRLFAVLSAEVYAILSNSPSRFLTATQVLDYIETWRELFARQATLTAAQQVGLWGELETLSRISPIDQAVEVWRGCEGKTFDFSGNGLNIETKTARSRPVHRFSIAQLLPPGTGKLFVVSVTINEDEASGDTLEQKVRQIRDRLADPLAFEKKLVVLGYEEGTTAETKYSLGAFKLHAAGEIPRPRQVDPDVLELTFSSDLTRARCLDSASLQQVLATIAAGTNSPRNNFSLKRARTRRTTSIAQAGA